MRALLRRLLDSLATSQPVAYCRLVETRGSTPQKAGAGMLVFADGSQAGTLGGGCVEAEVKRKALAALSNVAEFVRIQPSKKTPLYSGEFSSKPGGQLNSHEFSYKPELLTFC